MMAETPRDQQSTERPKVQPDYGSSMSAYRSGGPTQHSRRHRLLSALAVLLVLVAAAYFWWPANAGEKVRHGADTVINHIDGKAAEAARAAAVLAAVKAAEAQATATFSSQVNIIIAAHPAITFSVSTVTAYSGLQHYGSAGTFRGASTGKLVTAADFLHRVETGRDSLSEQIDGTTAEHLLDIMIVNSDDNAWNELNDHLTYPGLQTYADSIGFSNYKSLPNTFTSDDVAGLLDRLYNGQLLNASHTALLLGYLKIANYRQYVVPAVPATDTVYHKVGLYLDNVHDATIITNGAKTLVLVIFTNGNGTQDWPGRAVIMQQIARDAIADYL